MRLGIPLFGVLSVLLQAKRIGEIERSAPALDQSDAEEWLPHLAGAYWRNLKDDGGCQK